MGACTSQHADDAGGPSASPQRGGSSLHAQATSNISSSKPIPRTQAAQESGDQSRKPTREKHVGLAEELAPAGAQGEDAAVPPVLESRGDKAPQEDASSSARVADVSSPEEAPQEAPEQPADDGAGEEDEDARVGVRPTQQVVLGRLQADDSGRSAGWSLSGPPPALRRYSSFLDPFSMNTQEILLELEAENEPYSEADMYVPRTASGVPAVLPTAAPVSNRGPPGVDEIAEEVFSKAMEHRDGYDDYSVDRLSPRYSMADTTYNAEKYHADYLIETDEVPYPYKKSLGLGTDDGTAPSSQQHQQGGGADGKPYNKAPGLDTQDSAGGGGDDDKPYNKAPGLDAQDSAGGGGDDDKPYKKAPGLNAQGSAGGGGDDDRPYSKASGLEDEAQAHHGQDRDRSYSESVSEAEAVEAGFTLPGTANSDTAAGADAGDEDEEEAPYHGSKDIERLPSADHSGTGTLTRSARVFSAQYVGDVAAAKAVATWEYHFVRSGLDEIPAGSERVRTAAITSLEQLERRASGRDWNDEYQNLYERITNTPFEDGKRYADLTDLTEEFVNFATKVVEVLVEEAEVGVDPSKRLVKPASVGGYAGGVKHLVGGVFFKFALDWKNIYSSEALAQKAANLDITGLNAVIVSDVAHLHTSLSACIRLRGFVITAIALAPLDNSTRVHGSGDAGRTIHDSSPVMRTLMLQLADSLNLKMHRVSDAKNKFYTLPMAVDVEGHRSNVDGRSYIVDCGRLLPAVPPRPGKTRDFLTALFRPEFMRRFCAGRPLSADSFSYFGRHDAAEHHEDVYAAYERLRSEVIPSLAAQWRDALADPETSERLRWRSSDISNMFHSAGVNMRYLMYVYRALDGVDEHDILLHEAVVRCMKTRLREYLRLSKSPQQENFLVRSLLSWAFGGSASEDARSGFWNYILPEEFGSKYGPRALASVAEAVERLRAQLWGHTAAAGGGDADGSADVCRRFAFRLLRALNVKINNKWNLAEMDMQNAEHVSVVDDVWRCFQQQSDAQDAAARERFTFEIQPYVKTVHARPFTELADAEKLLNDAIGFREAALGPNHPQLCSSLTGLLHLYQKWSEIEPTKSYEEGKKVAERIVATCEAYSAEEHEPLYGPNASPIDYLLVAGEFLTHFFDTAAAYEVIQRAVALASQRKNQGLRLALALRRRSQVRRDLGMYLESRGDAQLALEVIHRVRGPADLLTGAMYVELALTRVLLNDVDQAQKDVKHALMIFGVERGEEHPSVAHALIAQGRVCYQRGDVKGKLKSVSKALAILEHCYGPEHAELADVLIGLANAQSDLDRYDDAMASLDRAMEISVKAWGGSSSHPTASYILRERAVLLGKLGGRENNLKRLGLLQRAVQMEQEAFGERKHPEMFRTLTQLGLALMDLGMKEELATLMDSFLPSEEDLLNPASNIALVLQGVGAKNFHYLEKITHGTAALLGEDFRHVPLLHKFLSICKQSITAAGMTEPKPDTESDSESDPVAKQGGVGAEQPGDAQPDNAQEQNE